MNVLHVITSINRGGAQNHLVDLIRHQSACMAVSVAYLRGDGYWADALRDMGVNVHDLGLRFYGDLRPLRRLRRIIREANFDLVHAHLPPAELYARMALIGIDRTQLPLAVSKHNDEPFHKSIGERSLGRWVARRAAVVVAISDAVNRYMAGPALGIEPARLETIHYGIDARPFAATTAEQGLALRRRWGIPNEAVLIGFAGRLVPQKSLETLLEGFALLRKRSSTDFRLALVGSGELEAPLRERANVLGIADAVVWPGFHDDMPAVMRAFDVFALTSLYEGFGLVLVEAMATARPVVATRVSAIPEIVVDGETGFLISPRSPEELANALQKLESSTLRDRLGAAGQRRVMHDFTLERMYEATDNLYTRLQASRCDNRSLRRSSELETL